MLTAEGAEEPNLFDPQMTQITQNEAERKAVGMMFLADRSTLSPGRVEQVTGLSRRIEAR